MDEITIIYIYRNRDTDRVRRSLESLDRQDDKRFRVLFVDYGSDDPYREDVERLVSGFAFCRYVYSDTRGMPWNRSHALNTGIRLCNTPHFFTSDIDMVFDRRFVSALHASAVSDEAVFFRVYYLPEGFDAWDRMEGRTFRRSEDFALGLALLPTAAVTGLRGYDEFFCYWGIEDNDMHRRLERSGLKTRFYDEAVLMYHQHHAPAVASAATFPEGWGAFQLAYSNDRGDEVKRNTWTDWGIRYDRESRKAWNRLQDAAAFTALEGNGRFFAYKVQRLFVIAGSGEAVAVRFTDTLSGRYRRSNLGRFAAFLQKTLNRLGVPVRVDTRFRPIYLTAFEARDLLMVFILSNRSAIADYAFVVEEDTLRFVIWKA